MFRVPGLSTSFTDTNGRGERWEFHISHDASLHTILSSFRTHVILSVLISSTGTRQLNNGGKRLVLPIKPSVPLLCRSVYDFCSTFPNISFVKSKRVFWLPISEEGLCSKIKICSVNLFRIDSNTMHCISCALNVKRKVGKSLLFKQTLRSRFTCLARQHFSFDAKKSLERERPFSLALRVVSLLSCLSRLAPSVTRVVIYVSRAFCSTDQERRETAPSLINPSLTAHASCFHFNKLGLCSRK